MSTYNRPKGMKYTDMAIYIDAHLKELADDPCDPEVEAKIYEYLYHLIYALSYKAGYFNSLEYYDDFALYGAGDLFMSMRKKCLNVGKVVRGKEVVPIKSSLNYIKSVLFPLKVNYQRQYFATVLNPEEGHNTSGLADSIKEGIQQQYSLPAKTCYEEALKELKDLTKGVIWSTPFKTDRVMCKKLYFSVLLTLLTQATLPNKLRRKIDQKEENNDSILKDEKQLIKTTNAYKLNTEEYILWHLDESYANYVKILTTRVKKEFSKTVNYYLHEDDLSDEMLDNIMNTVYENYNNTIDRGDNY